MTEKNLLTEGRVLPVLMRFTVPFLIANIIQALYGAVDLAVIGWFCDPASVAAVSTGTQVTQIVTSLITGLTLGGTILVGKYTGMRDEKQTCKSIGTTLTVFAAFSVVLMILVIGLASPILTALQTPEEAFVLARQYVVTCGWGIPFICGYNAISAILRGYGDSQRPMLFIALACMLNIAGDLLLTGVFGWGVRGVAVATIAAQAVSMVCAIVYLNRGHFIFKFTVRNLRIDGARARELARVGIPISFQELMVRISFLYLTAVVNALGVDAASAVGVASKYDVFAMLPATSVASALAAFTAQNYGAQRPTRVRTAVGAGLGFALAAAACFFLWAQLSPQSMIGLFTRDAATIAVGVPFFRACSFDYLMVTFVFCLNGYLNGRSKTLFTMFSCCFGALCVRIPLLYLVQTYRPDSLFLLGCVAPLVSGVMAVYTIAYTVRQFRLDLRPALC